MCVHKSDELYWGRIEYWFDVFLPAERFWVWTPMSTVYVWASHGKKTWAYLSSAWPAVVFWQSECIVNLNMSTISVIILPIGGVSVHVFPNCVIKCSVPCPSLTGLSALKWRSTFCTLIILLSFLSLFKIELVVDKVFGEAPGTRVDE